MNRFDREHEQIHTDLDAGLISPAEARQALRDLLAEKREEYYDRAQAAFDAEWERLNDQ